MSVMRLERSTTAFGALLGVALASSLFLFGSVPPVDSYLGFDSGFTYRVDRQPDSLNLELSRTTAYYLESTITLGLGSPREVAPSISVTGEYANLVKAERPKLVDGLWQSTIYNAMTPNEWPFLWRPRTSIELVVKPSDFTIEYWIVDLGGSADSSRLQSRRFLYYSVAWVVVGLSSLGVMLDIVSRWRSGKNRQYGHELLRDRAPRDVSPEAKRALDHITGHPERLELIRQRSAVLRMVVGGAYALAVAMIVAGVWLYDLGASGTSEFVFFGQTFKSANGGIAAIFLGAATAVLLIRRALTTLDRSVRGDL